MSILFVGETLVGHLCAVLRLDCAADPDYLLDSVDAVALGFKEIAFARDQAAYRRHN